MFQNQINKIYNDIKKHYGVFSFKTIEKFDNLITSGNLENLLEYCKISTLNDGGDPMRVIGRLEMLNEIIKEIKTTNSKNNFEEIYNKFMLRNTNLILF